MRVDPTGRVCCAPAALRSRCPRFALAVWTGVGAPWAICITPGPKQYLYSSDAVGPIYKLDLEGHVLGKFGTAGKQMKEFGWIHEMNCTSENELLVGELLNWRVQKLDLHPQAK